MQSTSATVKHSSSATTNALDEDADSCLDDSPSGGSRPLSPKAAQRIVIALMFPSMLMPIVSSMTRVALPIIRDDFGITADMTAWVSTSYTLPFLILMPVYGRLSNGIGRRRLLLAGMAIFGIGTTITFSTADLTWLMIGRAIQGIGTAGITPLGMAIISSIFSPAERGKALGTWSSIGPTAAALAPLSAGFLVDWGGWRLAFVPPLILAAVAILVVANVVPAGLSNVQPNFLRRFDWTGVLLLGATLTFFLFFLSSRPITNVAPLNDWRLFGAFLLCLIGFIWWEKRHSNPFILLSVFSNRMFSVASCSAAFRMVTMAGASFLTPLFLADVYGMRATTIGFMLVIMPLAMMLMVRFGGQLADRWGSQRPVLFGFVVQIVVMLLFAQVEADTSLWIFGAILALHGLGVGLMLAALHSASIQEMNEQQIGVAAGLYSMIRFLGMAIGTALSGVILQRYVDQELPLVEAYQSTYQLFALAAVAGLILALVGMRAKKA